MKCFFFQLVDLNKWSAILNLKEIIFIIFIIDIIKLFHKNGPEYRKQFFNDSIFDKGVWGFLEQQLSMGMGFCLKYIETS